MMMLEAISNTLLGRVAAICSSYRSSLGRCIGFIDHKTGNVQVYMYGHFEELNVLHNVSVVHQ